MTTTTTYSLSAKFSSMLEFSAVDATAAGQVETPFFPSAQTTVANDEPGTLVWYGLKRVAFPPGSTPEPENQYAIFDILSDEAAKTAHNAGNVPPMFIANTSLFTGGAQTTLQGIKEYNMVTTEPVVKERVAQAEYVAYTPMTAQAGKEEALKTALVNSRQKAVEHGGTSFWAILQIGTAGEFAMVDMFDNLSSLHRNTDFNRSELVEGGDAAVVPHLYAFVANSRKDNYTVTTTNPITTSSTSGTSAAVSSSVSVLALTVATFVMRLF